ncbi:MAG: CRTAC1 family protein [Acidobacteria bacterium]|nr:CRTAC1 family protein [Acidobacteriota bacterium]MCI0720323.1 CRTAC1 family protein [Acidobacteriota bacterium]
MGLSQPWSGWSCGFVDLDNDGYRDFFTANGGLDVDAPQPNRIFRNVGKGRFSDASPTAGTGLQVRRLHRGAAFADFDNDGRLDVVVTALNDRLELLMNRGPRRHWLQLKLRGRASNRSGLGARVVCESASHRQISWVSNSIGYASASDLRVHFGLGEDRVASWVEIRWPSGAVQKLANVAADQILEVIKPST